MAWGSVRELLMLEQLKPETDGAVGVKSSDVPMLVVDLDGTLLRSDILHETFWNSIVTDWKNVFLSCKFLFKGKAALKEFLANSSNIDIKTLPYDPDVIDYINRWRAKGGRTALVTASDHQIARAIAHQLGNFDEVHGSNGVKNLKGAVKASFLENKFLTTGYYYIGDSTADIPVWESAKGAVIVNANRALKKKTEFLQDRVEHLQTTNNSLQTHFKALRPHQWLKNLLVFLPLLAAQRFDNEALIPSTVAFISFSIIASSVYVLNDLVDLKSDRLHIRKRLRPFASGSIPIAHGPLMIATLILLGAAVSLFVGYKFVVVLTVYFSVTLAYSLYLKRAIVLDICVLACLYTLRVVAGSVAADLYLSAWLVAFSFFIFFSLASIKRQAELVDLTTRNKLKASGRSYIVDDLPLVSQIAIASGYVAVLVMALYVNSSAVVSIYSEPTALWGICLVLLYWITRMVLVTYRGKMDDDPMVYAAKDPVSFTCFLLILGCVLGATVL